MAITLGRPLPEGIGSVLYAGTYTHTAGAAEETFTLGSGQCEDVRVSNLDSGSKKELVKFTQSGSTVTINATDTVADGRIFVRVRLG